MVKENIEIYNANRARLKDYRIAYRLLKKNDAIDIELQKRLDFINVDAPTKKELAHDNYMENRTNILALKKIKDAENKPKNKIYADKYYKKNRDKILAKSRVYYELNKEALLDYNKIYVNKNRERLHDYRLEYYNKNNK